MVSQALVLGSFLVLQKSFVSASDYGLLIRRTEQKTHGLWDSSKRAVRRPTSLLLGRSVLSSCFKSSMSQRVRFTISSKAGLPQPHASLRAAYLQADETAAKSSARCSPSPNNDGDSTIPFTAEPTPHQIAIKRAKNAQSRFATAHESWLLVAEALIRENLLSDELAFELQAFVDAICAQYAAASFLWWVLEDMDPEREWLGEGEGMFDATLRRLRTLRGLEGCLVCWEGVLLKLVTLVDGEGPIEVVMVVMVRRLLGQWRVRGCREEGRKSLGREMINGGLEVHVTVAFILRNLCTICDRTIARELRPFTQTLSCMSYCIHEHIPKKIPTYVHHQVCSHPSLS